MTITFLTNGGTHGQCILQALRQRNLLPSTILIERPPNSRLARLRRSINKYGVWETALDVLAFVGSKLAVRSNSAARFRYEDYASAVFTVADFNHPDAVALVQSGAPDLLVLGGSRILRPPILSTARLAVLNAHPGQLPTYRGVDVVPWAIYNGHIPVVSVHCVDAGVDTGAVVSEQPLSIEVGDTISTLRRKAERLAGEMMAEAVQSILETRTVKSARQPECEGKQYYRMPRQLMRQAENRLRCQWKPHA